MKVKNVGPDAVLVPELGWARVDPRGVVGIPPERAEGYLCQPWQWEAADAEARAVVAEHLDAVARAAADEDAEPVQSWWDHPRNAEIQAAGGTIASRPKPRPANTTANEEG
jgi:hypothetical protein